MTLYQIPSLNPELTVSVGWDARLASYVAQVEGVPAVWGAAQPPRLLVAWFGRRRGELRTVKELQDAIGGYAVLHSNIRAALEADRAGRAEQPASTVAASAPIRLVTSNSTPEAAARGVRALSLGRTLRDLALIVAVAVVIVVLVLAAVIAAAANL
jgi:hypothetical protein